MLMLKLQLDVSGDIILVQLGDIRKFSIVGGKVVLTYTDTTTETLIYTDYAELNIDTLN